MAQQADHDAWRVTVAAADAEALAALQHDRVWNCFAIADLLPPNRQYCQYAFARHADSGACAVILVFRHPAFTNILPYGSADGIAAILARIALPEHTLAHALPEHLPALTPYYRFPAMERWMLRMHVDMSTFTFLSNAPSVEPLTRADAPALLDLYTLYAEGHFRPDLLDHGVFFGVRDGERILAAGGTHVVAREHGLAVLGNIFTHPDARRRGYASAITAAVTKTLFGQGYRDVVLTVVAANDPAIRVYARLGFAPRHRYLALTGERWREGHAILI